MHCFTPFCLLVACVLYVFNTRAPTPDRRTSCVSGRGKTRSQPCKSRLLWRMLDDADPVGKRAIYRELGVKLTYHTDGR